MPIELDVPLSINPAASDTDRSRARAALFDALEALCAGVRAEGRATEYEVFVVDSGGSHPLTGEDVDSLEQVFVREVWESEELWQTHREKSGALAEFRIFRTTYAFSASPSVLCGDITKKKS